MVHPESPEVVPKAAVMHAYDVQIAQSRAHCSPTPPTWCYHHHVTWNTSETQGHARGAGDMTSRGPEADRWRTHIFGLASTMCALNQFYCPSHMLTWTDADLHKVRVRPPPHRLPSCGRPPCRPPPSQHFASRTPHASRMPPTISGLRPGVIHCICLRTPPLPPPPSLPCNSM